MIDRQAIDSTAAHFDHVDDDDIEWIIKYYETAKCKTAKSEYIAFTYYEGRSIIGTAEETEDGIIRVFCQLQPIDGVFYLKEKKRKEKAS
jgi:hypothetical protein